MREREGGLVARAKERRPGGGMPPQREASGEKMKKTRCEGFHSSFPASGQERRGQTLSHANPRHAELFSRFSKRKERKEEREEDGEELGEATPFTEAAVEGERAFLRRPLARGFERPYGWAWLLKLQAELIALGGPWAARLAPLAADFADRFRNHLPLAT